MKREREREEEREPPLFLRAFNRRVTSSNVAFKCRWRVSPEGNHVTGSRETSQDIHRAEKGTSQRLRGPSARGAKSERRRLEAAAAAAALGR